MVTPSLVDSSSSISNCLRIYPSFTSLTPKLFGERELNFSHDVYNLRKKIPCLNKFLVCLIAENAQLKKNTRFRQYYTCYGYDAKTGVVRILVIFKIDLCSVTSFKRSWRDLSIDVAEHRSILKNNQNT